jgi:outer membrane protein assembly factor BamD (BamD/ComL family)
MTLVRNLSIVAFGLCALLPACGNAALAQHRQQEQLARDSSAKQLLENGDASASVGDMTRAEQYYVAALKAGGNERDLVQRLLVVCASDQRYPVAAEYAEQYLHRHPLDADLKFAAGSLHAALGDAHRARELFESVVRDKPEWAEAHYALASLLRAQSEPLALADQQDLEYLRLSPQGALAETARARLSRRALP